MEQINRIFGREPPKRKIIHSKKTEDETTEEVHEKPFQDNVTKNCSSI